MGRRLKPIARNKKVAGVGINDANYPVLLREGNQRHTCPKYALWCRMLSRCYDEKTQTRQPTYVGCSVCEEWLTFSNFLKWLNNQHWEDRQLDKDLIKPFNVVYSPELCCFVTRKVNTFLKTNRNTRGDQPLWVQYKDRKGLYETRVNDPFKRYSTYVGSSRCPIEAHKRGQARKHQYAIELAESESDLRVKSALMTRFSEDKNWLDI